MVSIETRKVQLTGGSSYTISLPKEWIRKYGIEKNDLLGISSQPDGNLLITPKIDSKYKSKTKIFDFDEICDLIYLFRLLIGAYIIGISRFEIKSSKKIDISTRKLVIKFTQVVIGIEIVEETNNLIVLKDLLNPKEMPIQKTIKRMYILAENMHSEVFKALEDRNEELAKEIIKSDNDIDRLHWLIGRQANIMFDDIILAQKMDLTLEDAHFYHQVSKFLERIADHSVNIANHVIKIMNNPIKDGTIRDLSKASKLSIDILVNSLDAWLQRDIKKANENIDKVADLTLYCEEISRNIEESNIEQSIALSYILESVRRSGEYAADISEIVINHLMREKKNNN